MINIEDVSKVEIRTGTILEIDVIEGSEKLLKLKVDFGELGVKQVLSGIRKFFEQDYLLGKQFIFITNLEPRKMLGLESEAMILATGEAELALFTPTKTVPNGSRLR